MSALEIPIPAAGSAVLIKARAAIATLLVLLAVNGVLPLLGHTPAGIWHAAEAVASSPAAPAVVAPAKASPGK